MAIVPSVSNAGGIGLRLVIKVSGAPLNALLPRVFIAAPRSISVSFVQSSNAERPISVTSPHISAWEMGV